MAYGIILNKTADILVRCVDEDNQPLKQIEVVVLGYSTKDIANILFTDENGFITLKSAKCGELTFIIYENEFSHRREAKYKITYNDVKRREIVVCFNTTNK